MAFLEQTVRLPGVAYAEDAETVVASYGVVTTRKLTLGSEALRIVRGDESFLSRFALEVGEHRHWQRELDGLVDGVAF